MKDIKLLVHEVKAFRNADTPEWKTTKQNRFSP